MSVSTSVFDAALTTKTLILTEGTSGVLPAVGDNLVNEEPIHDTTRDVDADMHNRVMAYLAEVALRVRPGNLVTYIFSVGNLAAGATDQILTRMSDAVDTALTKVIGWRGGSVVGATAWLENAVTAGGASAVVVEIRDGGTKLASMPQLILDDTTNTQKNRVNQLPGVDTFAALAELDVVVTTDGAFAAGATPTLQVELYVSYGGEDEAL